MIVRVKDQPVDEQLLVYIENDEDGVKVLGRDGDGFDWSLCRISSKGISLYSGVSADGITVDKDGYLKVSHED